MALQVVGYENLTVATTAVSLTSTSYGNSAGGGLANRANIYVESAPIRVRLDGTAPTSSSGDLVDSGGRILLQSEAEIRGFKAISQNGATATLRCTYETDQ